MPTLDDLINAELKGQASATPKQAPTLDEQIRQEAEAQRYKPTPAGALASGFVQGASGGFEDEAQAAGAKVGFTIEDILRKLWGLSPTEPLDLEHRINPNAPKAPPREAPPSYTEVRDDSRAKLAAEEEAHPKLYGTGQIAGGVTTAVAGGAASGLANAAKTGGAYGAVYGAGESEADLTKGDVGGLLVDTTKGAIIGAVSGGVGHGVSKGVRAVIRKFRGASGAARSLADEVRQSAGEVSEIGFKRDVAEATKLGTEIEKRVSSSPSVEGQFRLRPSQLTGDRSAAIRESAALQAEKTASRMQEIEARQLEQLGAYVDDEIAKIAANPQLLGRRDVTATVAKAVDAFDQKLLDKQASATSRLYARAADAAGDTHMFPLEPIREASKSINKYLSGSEKALGRVAKLANTADKSGAVVYEEIKTFRTFWAGVAQGRFRLGPEVSQRESELIAHKMLKAIDESMEAAAERFPAASEAGDLLRRANNVFRIHTEHRDKFLTETVLKLAGLVEGDTADMLVPKLLAGKSTGPIEAVFKVLNKASPAAAKDLRAQLVEDVLVGAKAKLPMTGTSIAREEGARTFSPAKALRALVDNEAKIMAAFAGDNQAKLGFRHLVQALQRGAFQPKFNGPQTAFMNQVLAEGGQALAGVVGKQAGKAVGVTVKILGNQRALAEAIISGETSNALAEGIKALSGKPLSESAALAIMATLTRAGLDVTSPEKTPTYRPRARLGGRH